MKHSCLVGANLGAVLSAQAVDAGRPGLIEEVVCGDLVMGPAIEGNDLCAGVS